MAPYDTDWPACSSEFCPTPGLQNIFACGTYKLDSSDAPGETPTSQSAPQHRRGKCLVFEVDSQNEGDFKNIQEIELPAILDMKWCHGGPEQAALLAIADSESNISLRQWNDAERRLECAQTIPCATPDVLCLSLDWSNRRQPTSGLGSLVVSLSNRTLAILRSDDQQGLSVTDTWEAHDFEPWIAAWDYWDTNVIFSGGDDLKLKSWDVRQGFAQPTCINQRFDAGVTTIQSHPFVEHLLAVGSYDSTVRLFDTRRLGRPLVQADVGGGAWRVKWHPSPSRKQDLLVACMHDGFKVLSFGDVLEGDDAWEVKSRFDEHQSLAYGVDWSFAELDSGGQSLITSCSFYDHLLNVWRA